MPLAMFSRIIPILLLLLFISGALYTVLSFTSELMFTLIDEVLMGAHIWIIFIFITHDNDDLL